MMGTKIHKRDRVYGDVDEGKDNNCGEPRDRSVGVLTKEEVRDVDGDRPG
jgi:hypothetical protein